MLWVVLVISVLFFLFATGVFILCLVLYVKRYFKHVFDDVLTDAFSYEYSTLLHVLNGVRVVSASYSEGAGTCLNLVYTSSVSSWVDPEFTCHEVFEKTGPGFTCVTFTQGMSPVALMNYSSTTKNDGRLTVTCPPRERSRVVLEVGSLHVSSF